MGPGLDVQYAHTLHTPHTPHTPYAEVFDALKEQHGSKFGFHGSPIENWHCILREGLRSHSGSRCGPPLPCPCVHAGTGGVVGRLVGVGGMMRYDRRGRNGMGP